ncbi:amidohydrolase family protein [Azospirillum canadense]|uniref:amidohydrolase family protein n=1 Tax=Azospirillum canadense TaxID=403962 RepID=UPI002225E2CD|nr:amidohydrolase family protein [Azospirillum canadense]MCW2241420.1 putative TIM-barrel fold metal-dependent hydrolase [Azospirillum canadense]
MSEAKADIHLPVRPDWLALHSEPVLEPELAIIDPHHHLWDRPGARYLLPELLEDTSAGHRILATVFIQCQAMYRRTGPEALRPVGETEFINGIAAMAASGTYGPTLACAGIVGHADLRLGDAVEEVLLAHIRAGGDRFRGIRHITAWDADLSLLNPRSVALPRLMEDRAFRAGFARLGRLGLSFDAWILHPQIGELAALADSAPETQVILDHAGGPVGRGAYAGRREAIFPTWAASIRELAKRDNVVVKLGGMTMRVNGFGFEQRPAPPNSEEVAAAWRPYVETCIEAFGADRCMFESNFPVDKGSQSYVVMWNACKRLARGASDDEKAALFRETARRVYRLQLT